MCGGGGVKRRDARGECGSGRDFSEFVESGLCFGIVDMEVDRGGHCLFFCYGTWSKERKVLQDKENESCMMRRMEATGREVLDLIDG